MKTNKPIVMLFVTPALQVDVKKFRLLDLKKLCDDVTIIDLSKIFKPDVDERITAPRLEEEGLKSIRMTKKKEIKEYIDTHRDSFYLPMFDDYHEVRSIYRLFIKYHIQYGYVNGLFANIDDVGIPKIQIEINKFHIKHLTEAFYNRILRKCNKVNPAKFFFYPSEMNKEHYFWRGNNSKSKTKILPLHSFDYDNYLATNPFPEEKYAVFLDGFFPYHPDLMEDGLVDLSTFPTEEYFTSMNQIFEEVERQTGRKVLIASHPRGNYNDKEFSFKKENIYYGRTAELVKGADFILGCWSTTNQMAVMSGKPLVIICNDVIQQTNPFAKWCMQNKEFYSCEMICKPEEVKDLTFQINEDKYNMIRTNYFSADNTTRPDLWEKIVAEIFGEE